jgi:hypothetical protein
MSRARRNTAFGTLDDAIPAGAAGAANVEAACQESDGFVQAREGFRTITNLIVHDRVGRGGAASMAPHLLAVHTGDVAG